MGGGRFFVAYLALMSGHDVGGGRLFVIYLALTSGWVADWRNSHLSNGTIAGTVLSQNVHMQNQAVGTNRWADFHL